MKLYKAKTIPLEYDPLFFSNEFQEIAAKFSEERLSLLGLEEHNGEPDKLFNGLMAYADGTNWDPGNGRGLYQYQNGTWVLIQGNKERNHVFDLSNFRKGATAPADSTLGTTPTVPTFYFSATNELISAYITLHEAWDKNFDIELELFWALATAQTNGDNLSVTLDYVVTKHDTTGQGPGKTSTQLTLNHQLTTAEGLAVGDLHPTIFTLAANDANNGFAPGDTSVGIGFEIHLTNVTEVADIHLLAGHLNYRAMY